MPLDYTFNFIIIAGGYYGILPSPKHATTNTALLINIPGAVAVLVSWPMISVSLWMVWPKSACFRKAIDKPLECLLGAGR